MCIHIICIEREREKKKLGMPSTVPFLQAQQLAGTAPSPSD